MKMCDRFVRAWRLVVPALACALVWATPAKAQDADEDFADFRIPDHRWRTGDLSIGGALSRRRSSRDGTYDISERNERADGGVTVSGAWQRDSDPVRHYLEVLGIFRASRTWSHRDGSDPTVRFEDESTNRSLIENWRMAAFWRRYPGSWPAAFGVQGSADAAYGQFWRRYDQEDVASLRRISHEDVQVWDYLTRVSADVFAGVGRVRDATGVYDVYVLERRLLDTGALTRPLAPGTRRRLAALFYAEPSFAQVFERPDKRFWREVERALEEDGALLANGMDAWDLYRSAEGLGVVTSVLRQRGYFIGPVARAQLLEVIRRTDQHNHIQLYDAGTLILDQSSSLSDRQHQYDSQIWAGVQGEYHRPIDWRWQFDASGIVIVPLQRVSESLQAQTSLVLGYVIADRWRADARLSQVRSYITPDDGTASSTWSVVYGSSVAYYVEDRLRLSLTWDSRHAYLSNASTTSHEDAFYLSLGYAFMRGLEAPGLFEPQRVP